jgi:DNA-binding NarL/FixJ family response regulator
MSPYISTSGPYGLNPKSRFTKMSSEKETAIVPFKIPAFSLTEKFKAAKELTPRQTEVLCQLLQGKDKDQIRAALHNIALGVLNHHIHELHTKVNASHLLKQWPAEPRNLLRLVCYIFKFHADAITVKWPERKLEQPDLIQKFSELDINQKLILPKIMEGKSSEQIGHELGRSIKFVRHKTNQIAQHLGVESTHAIAATYALAYIIPESINERAIPAAP